MKILMTGGGTGGHVNPAIAIANSIKRHHPDAVIEFVASTGKRDKANDLVPRAGYKLHKLDVCPSYGKIDPRNLKTVYYMFKSKNQAMDLILEFKPDMIIGTGGYACYPLLSAGASLGIPTAVHESNAKPGRAVKLLRHKVDVVLTNFDIGKTKLRGAKKVVCVGNPTLFEGSGGQSATTRQREGYDVHVLSFGGSGGATKINEEMCRILPRIAEKYPDVSFYHAAGVRDYPWMKENFDKSGLSKMKNVTLVEYIYDMNQRMADADVLICRAGAMTVSEVALMGRAAIFVPFPGAAANHQYENAKTLADGGACMLVTQDTFACGALTAAIERLIGDAELRKKYSENIRAYAKSDANEKIYGEIKKLLKI